MSLRLQSQRPELVSGSKDNKNEMPKQVRHDKNMKIDVSHVAKLANLKLKKGEIEKFEKQLSSILDYIKKLEELDIKDIEPTSQVTGLKNITREDITTPSLNQEEVLSNAPKQHNGLFEVDAIFQE